MAFGLLIDDANQPGGNVLWRCKTLRIQRTAMRFEISALLVLLAVLAPAGVAAQPTPPAAGAVGGALELPEFTLSADQAALERQLRAHRERLASAEADQRRDGGNATLTVLVEQLRFRISLLEIILTPLPVPTGEAGARQAQLATARDARDRLAVLMETAKSQGIGAQNLSVLELRLSELDAAILLLEGAPDAVDPVPPGPGSPLPPPPAENTPPAAPLVPADIPATAPAALPRLSLGDLMSALSNLPERVEEVQRLPEPLDPERVFVVPAETLFPGNGNGPVGRAIDRGYFADLRVFVAGNATLAQALAAAGYAANDAVGIMVDRAANVVIFTDR